MRDHSVLSTPLSRRGALGSLGIVAVTLLTGSKAGAVDALPPQQRILMVGDSQAQGLAGGVQRLYRGDKEHRVIDKSKPSTGLYRVNVYNWPEQARTFSESEHADVAIMLIGANDRPNVRIGGQVDPGLFNRFSDLYGGRVTDIAQDFRRAKVPLIWVGHPIVRDSKYAEDMSILNDLFESRATAEGATFMPTWDAFKGADGNFAQYGRGVDGATVRLRLDDGVHFTPAGYDVVTAMLVPLIDSHRRTDQPPSASAVGGPGRG